MSEHRFQIAIFVDQVFSLGGGSISTDESYVLFLESLAEAFDLVLIGREGPSASIGPFVIRHPRVSFLPIPNYPSLYELWRSDPRLYTRVARLVRRMLPAWDALLICGPHPIGQMIARLAIAAGKPLGLIVRQNLVDQMSAHRGLKRAVTVAAAFALERDFRYLARGRVVLTVGTEMADAYRPHARVVLNHFPCLVDEKSFHEFEAVSCSADPTRILTVCRLAPEKGHEFLFRALVLLRDRGIEAHAELLGTGRRESELRAMVAAMDLGRHVTFQGYVPYGPAMIERYKQCGAMVLPSLTEGFPQVINESLSLGIPTIATNVGGVPSFLTDGETALLVAPADPSAIADAVERLLREPQLSLDLKRSGRELMRDNTLERNRDRVIEVIKTQLIPAPLLHRSALETFPTPPVPASPSVAIVISLLNEAKHARNLLASVLAQDFPGLAEIWLVDGGSLDGTLDILREVADSDRRIRLIPNPLRVPAAAVNLVLERTRCDIVMRMDAHAEYGLGAVRASVECLLRSGAGGAGAVARPKASESAPLARAIVALHKSRLGIAVAQFRRDGQGGWVDTAWNTAYWRHVMQEAGPLRQDLDRAEDNEYSARVRALGYRIFLCPEIEAYYFPRTTLRALAKQYYSNGLAVGRSIVSERRAFSLRHILTLIFLAGIVVSAVLAVVHWSGQYILATVLTAYVAALIAATFRNWAEQKDAALLLLPVAFTTLHISHGLGATVGLIQTVIQKILRSRAQWRTSK